MVVFTTANTTRDSMQPILGQEQTMATKMLDGKRALQAAVLEVLEQRRLLTTCQLEADNITLDVFGDDSNYNNLITFQYDGGTTVVIPKEHGTAPASCASGFASLSRVKVYG